MKIEELVAGEGWLAFAVIAALLACGTSFLKFSVVLSLLRKALGLEQAPSGFILSVFAVLLSVIVMLPVVDEIFSSNLGAQDKAASASVWVGQLVGSKSERGALYRFLERNTDMEERARFAALYKKQQLQNKKLEKKKSQAVRAEDSFWVLLSAFVVTELSEAFLIGFLLFLPFVVVDLLCGAIIASAGLSSLPPNSVALPLKLLLFVLVSGWGLLSEGLILGYR